MSNQTVEARSPEATKREIYFFGGHRLEVKERRLWQGDVPVPLSPKAFDLLVVMLQSAGRLLEKDYLIRTVWPDSYVQDANLSVHIASIRKALGSTSATAQFIETIPKVGYRFVAPVSSACDAHRALAPAPASSEHAVAEYPRLPQLWMAVQSHGHWTSTALVLIAMLALACLVMLHWAKREKKVAETNTTTRPLIGPPGLFLQPAFSPDGQQLAYTWRSNRDSHQSVYVQRVSSGDRRLLADTGQDDYSPAWSPRGSEIAFLHSLGDNLPLQILAVDAKNPALRRIIGTICGANDAFRYPPALSWSPDAAMLVTTDCDNAAGGPSLARISVATGKKQELTHAPPRTVDDQAEFSPDGRWIAFRRSQGDSSDAIYLIASTGGQERRLTSDSNPIDGLAWSPDGTRIFFSSGRATSLGSIWSLPVGGGSPTAVTTPLTHTSSPAVSPVGRLMAYVDSPNNASVWRLSLNAQHDLEPFISSTFFDASAVYSPDGKRIAFRSDRSGANELWVCNSDGSQPQEITHFDGPMTGSPRWSPDGRSIAFDSRARGRSDIFVISVSGGQPTRLTDSSATGSDNVVPAWSHDGRTLYFSSNRSGAWQVWRHNLRSGAESQITMHGGFDAMETGDGCALIYVGDMNQNILHRLSLSSAGRDVEIASLGPGLWHPWTITRDYLYYVKRAPFSNGTTLVRMELGSHKSQIIDVLPQAINDSISVSPDEHQLLFARRSTTNSSIMILDGWN
ncbi:winged helix-turn-helix domain-containing protein [Silvibacterium dinghuense]|uniref:OmpR/PhoB-type domain-containing protein n=1 Tax=Silvibacterium dinghuense TaxID=1560006 RepID=A0A4Q1S7K2_9BACT|nr:winged helix-turn-helix domain-containing protein [Silvibacterium dinghuense]RXS92988.1 hypothetical protein ESZ00_19300 [Silvibacterium dinghuense]GGG90403.1 hypothetical protein GCM10011586_01020 [Silvibacterium dinghuense]